MKLTAQLVSKAKEGIKDETLTVRIYTKSNDPKYNATPTTSVDITAVVQLLGNEPKTEIVSMPPKLSAWKQASFEVQSTTENVNSFQWRLDGGVFNTEPCPSRACIIKVPSKNVPVIEYSSTDLKFACYILAL